MWSKKKSFDVVVHTTVIVYPVILPGRTELLVSIPSGLDRVAVPVWAEVLIAEVRDFASNWKSARRGGRVPETCGKLLKTLPDLSVWCQSASEPHSSRVITPHLTHLAGM